MGHITRPADWEESLIYQRLIICSETCEERSLSDNCPANKDHSESWSHTSLLALCTSSGQQLFMWVCRYHSTCIAVMVTSVLLGCNGLGLRMNLNMNSLSRLPAPYLCVLLKCLFDCPVCVQCKTEFVCLCVYLCIECVSINFCACLCISV